MRRTITARLFVVCLAICAVAAIAGTCAYFLMNSSSPIRPGPPTPTLPLTDVTRPPTSASPTPSTVPANSVIPLGAACKWAYPGQASGKTQGSGYSIVCLGTNGQALGGFSASHSLNAWCLDNKHTGGTDLPDPALINGTWMCTANGSGGQPPPSGTTPSPRPTSSNAPTAVTIPLGAACKWAYPGQASGKTQGSGYSIVCLGTNGQALGGFSASHSLNAWCADPTHTDNVPLPNPALVGGVWQCTT